MAAAEQQMCQQCSELRINDQPPAGCAGIEINSAEDDKCCCKGSYVIDTVVIKVRSIEWVSSIEYYIYSYICLNGIQKLAPLDKLYP